MPVKAAAAMAGMPATHIANPSVMAARLAMRKELQGRVAISKEDVIFGITEAIRDAKHLCEPMTQIKGYEAISKMLGYDAPKKLEIEHTGAIEVVQKNIRRLPDGELVKMLGAESVIDGDFYELKP